MKVRIASAGTGKTTSLVGRYLELLQTNTPLRRIAGVTFTRSAAKELRLRVGEALHIMQEEGKYLDWQASAPNATEIFAEAKRELAGATLTTIHGFMIQALRLSAPRLGLDPEFSLMGEWQADAIFEEEWLSLMYLASEPQHGLHQAWQEVSKISHDEGLELALLLFKQRSLAKEFRAEDAVTKQLLVLYQRVLERFRVRLGSSTLTPAEVERQALHLVQVGLERVAERYHIVLVDEYQDVNPLQGEFFAALEQAGIAVEVVGDPKQSIYAFRNAEVQVFREARAKGEELPFLNHTRRHSQILVTFLNSLSNHLGANNLGFSSEEAPMVTAAGEQMAVRGKLELHWLVDDAPIANLRHAEAVILAKRIKAIIDEGKYAASEIAVLARSYAGITIIEAALQAEGVPAVLLQGRGYFERLEIRDLYHALKVGIAPEGLSLAVFLRSPFAALTMPQLEAVLQDEKPLEYLRHHLPEIQQRLEKVQQAVRLAPLEAVKFLIREPFIGGKRYVDFLTARQRDNVDALLFTLVDSPPHDLEITLERLEMLSRQTDAGDVPQQGRGVSLLTIHASKGLEWAVVALFDMGRNEWNPSLPLRVHPHTGQVARQDEVTFDELRDIAKERSLQESYRLLYVAVSRARDVLLLSGSVKFSQRNGVQPSPWIDAIWSLDKTGKGGMDGSQGYQRADFRSQRYGYEPVTLDLQPQNQREGLEPAPWLADKFPLAPFPPVVSPSYLKSQADKNNQQEPEHEPLPFTDPEEGERLPGKGRTVGTLVHYAISQNWQPDNALEMDNLRYQEVMFPFTAEEQTELMEEVSLLLKNYYALMAEGQIAALTERSEDYPELPMALPELFAADVTVWQGIIDRLYCAEGIWYLEDYKTDQVMQPEQYYLQMALYLEVITRVRGIVPQVRLVYLRFAEIVVLEPAQLKRALEQEITKEPATKQKL